jgi:hypothetical protein
VSDNSDWDDDDDVEAGSFPFDPNNFWNIFNRGLYTLRDLDPDAAISAMTEARDKALEAGELRAAFYMNHWILQTIIFKKQDYTSAYDLAVKTAAESNKPTYENMKERVCVFQDLVLVHQGIDPVGYNDLIDRSIVEMNSRITRPVNCMFCVSDLRCVQEIAVGNLDAAEEATQRFMSLCEDRGDRHHYGVSAQARMCEIAHLRGDWQRMLHHAQIGEQWERNSTSMVEYKPFFSAALALAHRRLGNEDEARRYYRIAANEAASSIADEVRHYFDLMCAYHESEGDLQEAAALRQRELENMKGKGQLYREVRVRLEEARYLKQLKQPYAETLARAESLLPRLKKPEVFAEKIAVLKIN